MGFGDVITTTGAGPQSPESGSKLGDTTNVLPGPYVCLELSSDLLLTISLSIEQTIDAESPTTTVSFGILGDISIDGTSKRRCLPHYSAEAIIRSQSTGCDANLDQKYTAISMGGNPLMLFDEAEGGSGMAGRLFTKSAPKYFTRWRKVGEDAMGMYFALPVRTFYDPNNLPTGELVLRKPPLFQEMGVPWKKVNSWHEWPGFLLEFGSFQHMFNLEVIYNKTCGPKICYDCVTPENIAQSWNPNCRTRDLTIRAPIEITGTMPLADWLYDQDAEIRREGYLTFHHPYWYTGRKDPVPQPQKWAEGWDSFDKNYGPSEGNSTCAQVTEGPAYARYQGFGADIFEGKRDNDISQGLYQIKLELRELLQNAVATWEGGLPSENPDMFCGDLNLTDANIDQILRDFQTKWIESSLANDRSNGSPPPISGNVPGISEGY